MKDILNIERKVSKMLKLSKEDLLIVRRESQYSTADHEVEMIGLLKKSLRQAAGNNDKLSMRAIAYEIELRREALKLLLKEEYDEKAFEII
jgi:hypothetical protein